MDGIESDFAGKLQVLRLDVQSEAGQALAAKMRFAYTPTFIFFDGSGAEAWRSMGRVDPQQVRDSLSK